MSSVSNRSSSSGSKTHNVKKLTELDLTDDVGRVKRFFISSLFISKKMVISKKKNITNLI